MVVQKLRTQLAWVVTAVALCVHPAPSAAQSQLDDITATAAIIVDYQTGSVLYARNPDLELPPASTTKILTAHIALRSGRLNNSVYVSKYAASMQPSKIGLRAGWSMNVSDLVYATLLNSANDAAVALAEGLSGSVEDFAARMNRTAWQMGALNSHFVNPSGLPDDDHYSTVRDLTTIMRHALQSDSLERVLSTRTTAIMPTGGSRRAISLRSHNRMIDDPRTDVIGKTGWTRVAKKCFVGAATQDGRRVLVAVLGSGNLWGDLRRMVDWTFGNPVQEYRDAPPPRRDLEWQQAARQPVGIPRPKRNGNGSSASRSNTRPASKSSTKQKQKQKKPAFHVHLGTFRNRDEANRVQKRLNAGGYSTVVQKVKTRYRITVVGLRSRSTAQKVAQALRRAYRLDTQVVAADA